MTTVAHQVWPGSFRKVECSVGLWTLPPGFCQDKKPNIGDTKVTYQETADTEIQLNRNNYAKVYLPDKKGVLILFDSGSTKFMFTYSFHKSSRYLSQLKSVLVNPIKFRLGSFWSLDTIVQFGYVYKTEISKLQQSFWKILFELTLSLGSQTLSNPGGIFEFKSKKFRLNKGGLIWNLLLSLQLNQVRYGMSLYRSKFHPTRKMQKWLFSSTIISPHFAIQKCY